MPVHAIFRLFYAARERGAALSLLKLGIFIGETAKRHPGLTDLAASADQWAKTKNLASL